MQTQGSSEDWQETTPGSGTFDFTVAPTAGDEITVQYQTSTALNQVSKTTTYTALTTDSTILCDSSGGAWTLTLFTAVGNTGKRLTIVKEGSGTNKVTIDGNSTETIITKSETAQTIGVWISGGSITIESDGANWVSVGDNLIPHTASISRTAAQSNFRCPRLLK